MLDAIELEQKLEVFLQDRGFNLVDLHLATSGRSHTFRIFVEHANGTPADLNDCTWLSPMLTVFLEGLGVFYENSVLEVSSPGLDRTIKRDRDFQRYTGRQVRVSLVVEGKKLTILGKLQGLIEGDIAISEVNQDAIPTWLPGVKFEQSVLRLPRNIVEKVRLVPEV